MFIKSGIYVYPDSRLPKKDLELCLECINMQMVHVDSCNYGWGLRYEVFELRGVSLMDFSYFYFKHYQFKSCHL